MKGFVRLCAGRPVAVIMALFAVLIAGVQGARTMPLGRLPDISVPRVIVEATMPGLPAAEIRSLVAAPLEDALASAKGLSRSSSVSRDGRAIIVLDFRWGEDPTRASGRVRELIDTAYPSLPEGADKPTVVPYDPDAEPLVVLTVTPRGGDMAFAKRFAEYEARARLRRVEGAGSVTVVGGVDREVSVSVDARKAAARGLTVMDVARAVSSESSDVPAGSLREGELELVLVAKGRADDAEDLSRLVVAGSSGALRLSDIAGVQERNAPRKSLYVSDGKERVALELYARPGADPVATAKRVRSVAAEMSEEFGDDVDIEIVRDASESIAKSIRDLAIAGALGAFAAAAVLYAFLKDVTAAALVASSIPLSVAAALGVLSAAGRSLNGMSLGGVSLAIGMISDNAVVVLNALSSAFSSRKKRPTPQEVADATATTLSGTFGSMTTTAVVFIPVLFLPGAIGGLFGDLALSIIAANTSGWLIAVFAIPALYRLTWREARPARGPGGRRLEDLYRQPLRFALRRPALIIAGAAVLAIAGTLLAVTRPVSFMPRDAAAELEAAVAFPAGTDAGGMAERAREVSAALLAVPGVSKVYGSSGAERDDVGRRADLSYAPNILRLTCALDAGTDVSESMGALTRAAESALPGDVSVDVRVPVDPTARLLGLDKGSVLAARGPTREEALARADAAEERLLADASVAFVTRTPSGTSPRLRLAPDREAAAALGVSLADAAQTIRAATEGVTVGTLETKGREMDVRVFAAGAGSADASGSLAEAASVPVSLSGTASISAGSVVRFERVSEEAALARLDRSDVVYLEPTAVPGRERELGAATNRAAAGLPGVERSDESAFRAYGSSMATALVLVVALLYLTLGAQFESFALPLPIMATIPLAMAGTGPALAMAGIGLDSGSILGLVVLFGVVVNSAILLYETTSARIDAGAGAPVAAYAGALERARPVLATTMTTVVALLPLCLSPSGATQRSMSVAMVGGVIASTALTLFVSPILFAARRSGRPS